MYNTIIKAITRKNFELVNTRDFSTFLKSCAPDIYHRFGGTHALGGERHDRETLGRWFGRLARIAPQLKLSVHDIWVSGWPHDTTVIVRWSATDVLPDGGPYRNHGVHIVRLRWFKAVSIDANEDSQAVSEALKLRTEAGMTEASAAPIIS